MADPARTFVWRGIVREHRPMTESEVGLRTRGADCRHPPGPRERVCLHVGELTGRMLESIADRRGITVAEALELVCADVLGRRA